MGRPYKEPIIGKRFGKLVVIDFAGKNHNGRTMLLCQCDCGNTKLADNCNIGNSINSCGCLKTSSHLLKHGCCKRDRQTSEYKSWVQMKGRCYNPKNKRYKTYGARGITVCERWLNSFPNFIADMGLRPSKNHSLDRINNDLPYSAENCRWATDLEQSKNKTNNRWLSHNGLKLILAEWARVFKTTPGNLRNHLKRKPFADCYEFFKGK